jgi:hypothetical protein
MMSPPDVRAIAAASTVGRVEGFVRLISPANAVPIASGAYPTRRVSRPAPKSSEINNVVVFIKDAPRTGALTTMRAQMMQQDESFVPRLVAITRGSSVEFPNADPFFHNVFSLSRGATLILDASRAATAERASSISLDW